MDDGIMTVTGPKRAHSSHQCADHRIACYVVRALRSAGREVLSALALLVSLLSVAGCGHADRRGPGFRLLSPAETGVTFANTITTDDSVNVQTDPYVYNGAGVAIGDINNDG
ncbi:MAG TPA: hypothetical protein VH163_10715, partial [Gemmatimonadales bacterium]|nr:hypothetical protein [Gemmatimonadales bacterium]